jgi:hypothetical protein
MFFKSMARDSVIIFKTGVSWLRFEAGSRLRAQWGPGWSIAYITILHTPSTQETEHKQHQYGGKLPHNSIDGVSVWPLKKNILRLRRKQLQAGYQMTSILM